MARDRRERTATALGVFGRRFDSSRQPASAPSSRSISTRRASRRGRGSRCVPTGDFIVVWRSPQDDQARRSWRAATTRGQPDRRRVPGEHHGARGAVPRPTWRWIRPARPSSSGRATAQDGASGSVYGQRLDASGNKLGPEFNVNTFTTGFQGRARVAAGFGGLDPGEFAIIWQGASERGRKRLRRVRPALLPRRRRRRDFELPVNSFTTAFQGDRRDRGAAQRTVRRRVGELRQRRLTATASPRASPRRVPSRWGGRRSTPLRGRRPAPPTSTDVLEVGEQVVVEPALPTTSRHFRWHPHRNGLELPAAGGPDLLDPRTPRPTTARSPPEAASPTVFQATGDCYQFSLTGTRPASTRGYGASTRRSRTTASTRFGVLHVGGSFPDVPSTNPFYPFIENLFTTASPAAARGGGYCPASNVTRAQMAVFLLKARWGSVLPAAPATGTGSSRTFPRSNPFARWIEELVARGRHRRLRRRALLPGQPRHAAADGGIPAEDVCSARPTCPTRAPATSTTCPAPSPFADWIEDLAGRASPAGCQATPPALLPAEPVLRQQMAAFLVKTFGLQLY